MSETKKISTLLESIKFSHSIFALPFALSALLLALQGPETNLQKPDWQLIFWVVLAMVGARTWAMAVNRVVDVGYDRQNARTATRAVATGAISVREMVNFGALGAVLFLFSAAQLSWTAFFCAPVVLIILGSYSFAKRFTFLCHFWLGACLALAPLGVWLAVRDELSVRIGVLSAAILFWVAGFDIIYALQDEAFDRDSQLHSIPSRFGTKISLLLARLCHVIAALLFLLFGAIFNLGIIYFCGVGGCALLMFYEHWLVRHGNLHKIDQAFFNMNGYVAVLLFVSCAASVYFRMGPKL